MLRKLFGPSREEMWRQLATEVSGDYVKGGFWKGDKVQVKVKDWTVTLDIYVVSTGKSHTKYTRMRAPYVNPEGFRFTIYRKSIFTRLGRMLGMQDIEIGVPAFDEEFVVKSNDPAKIKALLQHEQLRQLIEGQPRIYLTVKDDEGWFGAEFPEGTDELYFQVRGVIKDVERLKSLFMMFAATLSFLCKIGSAYENDPGVKI